MLFQECSQTEHSKWRVWTRGRDGKKREQVLRQRVKVFQRMSINKEIFMFFPAFRTTLSVIFTLVPIAVLRIVNFDGENHFSCSKIDVCTVYVI